MTAFDTKISEGNAGLLRSRDMYHLMERLDFITGFLMFQGVSGHFTTIALMMCSMTMYILCLFLLSLSGTSLTALGGLTYSTEWLFHAGLTTIVPLVVEFLVEYGPVVGLLRSVAFLPISTMIYLFQMQTKYSAFVRGFFTGLAAHINTGRGLAIYRQSHVQLFQNYGPTHFFPALGTESLTILYYTLSTNLGGGTLPMIMIHVLCASVLISPQLFNPTLYGNSVKEAIWDLRHFITWVGKTETRINYSDWVTTDIYQQEESFNSMWMKEDVNCVPKGVGTALLDIFYHLIFLFFWISVATFLVYPHFQFWLSLYAFFWSLSCLVYSIIFYFFRGYEQPLRIILIFLGIGVGLLYYLVHLGYYGTYNFSSLYIPFMVFVKLLESLRVLALDFLGITAEYRFSLNTKENKENKDKFITYTITVLNKFFFIHAGRIFLAIAWGVISFLVALIMRPLWANWFLFGNNSSNQAFEYLNPMRKRRAEAHQFGLFNL
eukprot:TRINITY_DN11198_c0_g1_i2.p1 TRINITY_DN11198_c0_g1~~TRINITY_DN11198_c0_g1_i2.p1  ORF type:complete len:491 (-),score=63.74 TRINITY_DN11198_c0_g1_i2:167-1639(-)